MSYCLLGLGSNLKNPRRQLMLAIRHIKNLPHTRVLEVAPFFRNPAFGKKNLADYYNTVILIKTTTSPLGLLNQIQLIEKKQARTRRSPNASRTIDIDILTYGTLTSYHPRLKLPHPGMQQRESVQIPLRKLTLNTVLHKKMV